MEDIPVAQGRRILVVEDEYMIASALEMLLQALGALVIGPASSLEAAARLADSSSIDAAILDVNIRGGSSFPVADILAGRGIPFAFCSGYDDSATEERHRTRPRLTKPYSVSDLEAILFQLLNPPSINANTT